MARKLERDRLPKLPVGHPIDLTPPEGIPPVEKKETVAAADAERRSGQPAIRRTGVVYSYTMKIFWAWPFSDTGVGAGPRARPLMCLVVLNLGQAQGPAPTGPA